METFIKEIKEKMKKDEYEDFVLRYKGCGACFPMYHTLSRFEKMWFSAIQKDVAELEKENAELKQAKEGKVVEHFEAYGQCRDSRRIAELEAQIEKLIDFVLSKTECCDVCPITDTCINSEGTCPYAGILAKGEEEVTREWIMQFISKEIKEK